MYIEQVQLMRLNDLVEPGKAVLIFGARRVGKTTLIERFVKDSTIKTLLVTGEDIAVRDYLESQSIAKLAAFVGDHQMLVVDEAQYVRQIGLNLKLLIDHLPELRIVATGSSAFDLARDTGAPLAGRQFTLRLHPLSQTEMSSIENPHETAAHLEMRLIHGSYPEVVLANDVKRRELLLMELLSSYLFKDIFQLEGIRKPDKLTRLLQLLAFQIGKDVSNTELGSQLSMSKNTVDRYLDLLEKVFVVYHLPGFSRNLRKEVSKSRRYYFWDNGVRNAVINNFNPIDLRDDVGVLWENYVVGERMKHNEYAARFVNSYFWRTYDRKEIDLVEEFEGRLSGYEIKWGDKRVRAPRDWSNSYPDASFEVINRANYLSFISS
jgi:predicted AAA+ superfamily ATPase